MHRHEGGSRAAASPRSVPLLPGRATPRTATGRHDDAAEERGGSGRRRRRCCGLLSALDAGYGPAHKTVLGVVTGKAEGDAEVDFLAGLRPSRGPSRLGVAREHGELPAELKRDPAFTDWRLLVPLAALTVGLAIAYLIVESNALGAAADAASLSIWTFATVIVLVSIALVSRGLGKRVLDITQESLGSEHAVRAAVVVMRRIQRQRWVVLVLSVATGFAGFAAPHIFGIHNAEQGEKPCSACKWLLSGLGATVLGVAPPIGHAAFMLGWQLAPFVSRLDVGLMYRRSIGMRHIQHITLSVCGGYVLSASLYLLGFVWFADFPFKVPLVAIIGVGNVVAAASFAMLVLNGGRRKLAARKVYLRERLERGLQVRLATMHALLLHSEREPGEHRDTFGEGGSADADSDVEQAEETSSDDLRRTARLSQVRAEYDAIKDLERDVLAVWTVPIGPRGFWAMLLAAVMSAVPIAISVYKLYKGEESAGS